METLPEFACELQRLLIEKDEPELASQVPTLRIRERCSCGDNFCATFYTQPKPKGAALHPPHLAAINPWEGVSDFYREFAYHGGMPETHFLPGLKTYMSFSSTRVEDIVEMAKDHPLFDEYWASKNADLSRRPCPIPVFWKP